MGFCPQGGLLLSLVGCSEAPASTLRFVKQKADEEQGVLRPNMASKKNAVRSSRNFIKRWGLAWKVPITSANIAGPGQPEPLMASYIKPRAWLEFLVGRHPELVMGGFRDTFKGQDNLESFWREYQRVHPEHDMFQDPSYADKLRTTVPMCCHGDEGRGQKKGHTFCLMLEANLGVARKRAVEGSEGPCKKCRTSSGAVSSYQADHAMASKQVVNLWGHSFLTKFLVCALNNKIYKVEDEECEDDPLTNFFAMICEELRDISLNGVLVGNQRWYIQLTGMKGDLDFFRKVTDMKRCWKKQLGVGLPMCHECGAGDVATPFEDLSEHAAWKGTLWFARPWQEDRTPPICSLVFESSKPERAMRRDFFHNTKMGVFRDWIGGCVTLLMWLGYFNSDTESNNRKFLWSRAHSCFRLWCLASQEAWTQVILC